MSTSEEYGAFKLLYVDSVFLHPFQYYLIFTTLWGNSADEKLVTFFLLFRRKQDLKFHANCLHWRQFA